MREIINPFSNYATPEKEHVNLVAIASSDIANYNKPRSPVSGEEMSIVECSSAGAPRFKAWVHIKDRIVIPFRE